MIKKRERIDIIYDILVALANKPQGLKPTHIMHKANLAHRQLKTYTQELIKQGFIKEITEKKNTKICITEKGHHMRNKIAEMRSFDDAFGLKREWDE